MQDSVRTNNKIHRRAWQRYFQRNERKFKPLRRNQSGNPGHLENGNVITFSLCFC